MSQERGFGAVLASRVSAALDPGVVPPSPSWCCQHKPHLDEWGEGEPKTRNQLRKVTAFLSIVTAAAQACAAHIVEIKLLLVKSSAKKP